MGGERWILSRLNVEDVEGLGENCPRGEFKKEPVARQRRIERGEGVCLVIRAAAEVRLDPLRLARERGGQRADVYAARKLSHAREGGDVGPVHEHDPGRTTADPCVRLDRRRAHLACALGRLEGCFRQRRERGEAPVFQAGRGNSKLAKAGDGLPPQILKPGEPTSGQPGLERGEVLEEGAFGGAGGHADPCACSASSQP